MRNTLNLLKDINTKRLNWNERSQFNLKGVKNLSYSDLDTLELYAKTFDRTGSFSGLIEPRGTIAEVLNKYGIDGSNKYAANF